MKTPIPFIICIAMIGSGFVIGGRDGAIMSLVGSVTFLAYSLWMAIRINSLTGRDRKGAKEAAKK